MIFVTACRSELKVNVIHEEFDDPQGKTGTFFGASIALKPQWVYSAAPYYRQNSGVFKCSSGGNACTRGSLSGS